MLRYRVVSSFTRSGVIRQQHAFASNTIPEDPRKEQTDSKEVNNEDKDQGKDSWKPGKYLKKAKKIVAGAKEKVKEIREKAKEKVKVRTDMANAERVKTAVSNQFEWDASKMNFPNPSTLKSADEDNKNQKTTEQAGKGVAERASEKAKAIAATVKRQGKKITAGVKTVSDKLESNLSGMNSPNPSTLKSADEDNKILFQIYRWNEDNGKKPWMEDFSFSVDELKGPMVLDGLHSIKWHKDPTLAMRRSCREGVCGSCAVNVNGKNVLACITSVEDVSQNGTKAIQVRPLPHMEVIKDLVVDMRHFYEQYKSIKPWLQPPEPANKSHEFIQKPSDRKKLDGLYECILCACCTTACPSYWWAGDKFLGPAALLNAYRWIEDSRDGERKQRLHDITEGEWKLWRCHNIFNCADACPKGLNPGEAIQNMKHLHLTRDAK